MLLPFIIFGCFLGVWGQGRTRIVGDAQRFAPPNQEHSLTCETEIQNPIFTWYYLQEHRTPHLAHDDQVFRLITPYSGSLKVVCQAKNRRGEESTSDPVEFIIVQPPAVSPAVTQPSKQVEHSDEGQEEKVTILNETEGNDRRLYVDSNANSYLVCKTTVPKPTYEWAVSHGNWGSISITNITDSNQFKFNLTKPGASNKYVCRVREGFEIYQSPHVFVIVRGSQGKIQSGALVISFAFVILLFINGLQ